MLKLSLLFTTLFFVFMLHDTKVFAQHKEDTLLIKGDTKADTSGKNLIIRYNIKEHNSRESILLIN